jgi:hypothetical protein
MRQEAGDRGQRGRGAEGQESGEFVSLTRLFGGVSMGGCSSSARPFEAWKPAKCEGAASGRGLHKVRALRNDSAHPRSSGRA